MGKSIKGIPVLFENSSCLVLNKPSGLPVQGGEGIRVSLDSILSETISPRPFLVHRLDKESSGVILVAKTKEAAAAFSAIFAGAGRVVSKQYLGVSAGIPSPESGLINFDIEVDNISYLEFRKLSMYIFEELLGIKSLENNQNMNSNKKDQDDDLGKKKELKESMKEAA